MNSTRQCCQRSCRVLRLVRAAVAQRHASAHPCRRRCRLCVSVTLLGTQSLNAHPKNHRCILLNAGVCAPPNSAARNPGARPPAVNRGLRRGFLVVALVQGHGRARMHRVVAAYTKLVKYCLVAVVSLSRRGSRQQTHVCVLACMLACLLLCAARVCVPRRVNNVDAGVARSHRYSGRHGCLLCVSVLPVAADDALVGFRCSETAADTC